MYTNSSLITSYVLCSVVFAVFAVFAVAVVLVVNECVKSDCEFILQINCGKQTKFRLYRLLL